MRWQRDLDAGRPALTFDGTPAKLAEPINQHERVAVAFLLEDDRSRALKTGTPIVGLREVLAAHLTPGGPAVDALRLDYLVRWASANRPLAHREVSDEIADLSHTPGARLSNTESDAIHAAYRERDRDPAAYHGLVAQSLKYKRAIIDNTESVLSKLPVSRLRDVLETIEAASQEVWWRRVSLEALDLVRFGRTTEFWRNVQVRLLEKDEACALQLAAMADHAFAHDRALDVGAGEITVASVLSVDPIHLDVSSRRFVNGVVAVALHHNGEPVVERSTTTCVVQAGSFKFGQLSIAPLVDNGGPGLVWTPPVPLDLSIGDELVLADGSWFNSLLANGHELTVVRPPVDQLAAPKATCTPSSFAADPGTHRWCCRPHAVAEAETSDYFATQRAAGNMNPETWPPLIDEERFDVGDEAPADLVTAGPPDGLTPDDLD